MSEHEHKHEHDGECCGGKNHKEGEGCGCNCDNHHDHEHEIDYITITNFDGTDLDCAILGTFEVETIEDKSFIALLPKDSDEVILLSFVVDGEELVLDQIADEHFDKVSVEFMQLYGEENFEQ